VQEKPAEKEKEEKLRSVLLELLKREPPGRPELVFRSVDASSFEGSDVDMVY
jgi:hypothetical protein